MTITFKNGTTLDCNTVNSHGNQLIQGTMRPTYEIVFPSSAGFAAIKVLSQNTSALSEFTLQSDESTSVHSNFTIPVSLSEDLQSDTISLVLGQKTTLETTAEMQEETLVSILTDILPNI